MQLHAHDISYYTLNCPPIWTLHYSSRYSARAFYLAAVSLPSSESIAMDLYVCMNIPNASEVEARAFDYVQYVYDKK